VLLQRQFPLPNHLYRATTSNDGGFPARSPPHVNLPPFAIGSLTPVAYAVSGPAHDNLRYPHIQVSSIFHVSGLVLYLTLVIPAIFCTAQVSLLLSDAGEAEWDENAHQLAIFSGILSIFYMKTTSTTSNAECTDSFGVATYSTGIVLALGSFS
jgi:hypothetical protein